MGMTLALHRNVLPFQKANGVCRTGLVEHLDVLGPCGEDVPDPLDLDSDLRLFLLDLSVVERLRDFDLFLSPSLTFLCLTMQLLEDLMSLLGSLDGKLCPTLVELAG